MADLIACHFFYSSVTLVCAVGMPFSIFCAQNDIPVVLPAVKSFAVSTISILLVRISAAIFLRQAGIFDLSAVFAFFFVVAISKLVDILTKTFFSKVFQGTLLAFLTAAFALLSAQNLAEALLICAAASISVLLLSALLKAFLSRQKNSRASEEMKRQPFLFLFLSLILLAFYAFCFSAENSAAI